MSGSQESEALPPVGYELLDSGRGRKLERFGDRVVDRPCPQAGWAPVLRESRWQEADARFERREGWSGEADGLSEWAMRFVGFTFHLHLADSGQLGLFPEQRACWRWINERLGRGDNLLNLFAHTGGATLVAARAGASVCHVDGSRPAVARARENAASSGLGEAPVRWIVDDVPTFVAREIRRGSRYDAVMLDPPAFGRGPRGKRWKLEDVLGDTLARLFEILVERPRFVLVSAHSEGLDRGGLERRLLAAASGAGGTTGDELWLAGSKTDRRVPSGSWAAWSPRRRRPAGSTGPAGGP